MGVDDINEALEAGFLEGKLCNPVTVKFNDNTNQAIETICNAQGVTVAEWLRDLAIKNLVARKREFHRMEKHVANQKNKITMTNLNLLLMQHPNFV